MALEDLIVLQGFKGLRILVARQGNLPSPFSVLITGFLSSALSVMLLPIRPNLLLPCLPYYSCCSCPPPFPFKPFLPTINTHSAWSCFHTLADAIKKPSCITPIGFHVPMGCFPLPFINLNDYRHAFHSPATHVSTSLSHACGFPFTMPQ